MKPTRGFDGGEQRSPFQGVNYQQQAVDLPPGQSPEMDNMKLYEGAIGKRPGYSKLGGTVGSNETVLALVDFEEIDGSRNSLAFTEAGIYSYNTSTEVWTDISDNATTTWGDEIVNQSVGTEEISIQWTIGTDKVAGKRYVYATNGFDPPVKWDGETAGFELLDVSDHSDFVTCKAITIYHDQLYLGHIINSVGADEPQTILWSDIANHEEFLEGNAGAQLIHDLTGNILTFARIGDSMLVFSVESFAPINYIGGDFLIQVGKAKRIQRLLSPRCVVSLGTAIAYASVNSIHILEGEDVVDIGLPFNPRYENTLVSDEPGFAWGFFDRRNNNLLFGVPIADDQSVIYRIKPNPQEFTRDTFTNRVTAYGDYSRDDSLKIDDLQGVIDDLPGVIDGLGSDPIAPVSIFGVANNVMQFNETDVTDDGENFIGFWQSRDFTLGTGQSETARWLEIEFEGTGTSVDVSYSTDHGASWSNEETISLTSFYSMNKVDIDVHATTLRVRLRNQADTSFKFRNLRVWARPGGRR